MLLIAMHGKPKRQLVEPSIYTPRAGYEPPEPAWKGFDSFSRRAPAPADVQGVTGQFFMSPLHFSCCHANGEIAICSPASEARASPTRGERKTGREYEACAKGGPFSRWGCYRGS
jgi:hypothetical protein